LNLRGKLFGAYIPETAATARAPDIRRFRAIREIMKETETVRNVSDYGEGSDVIIGRNAVRELLKSGRTVDKIIILHGKREGSINELIYKAREKKIPIVETDKHKLETICIGEGLSENSHQGIIAFASCVEYVTADDILENAEKKGEKPFILIVDRVNDPHNLGALIRSAEAAGVHGVIIPKRQSAGISGAVMKASAGAAEHVPICKVPNLADTVEALKKKGVWTVACEFGGTDYTKIDFTVPCAVVLGSEGRGVSELLLSRCDFRASIPMKGKVNSLNVSCAGAVVMYEVVRQRS